MYFLHKIVIIFCWFCWNFLNKSWFFQLFCATLSRKFVCFVVSHDLSLEINQTWPQIYGGIWKKKTPLNKILNIWKSTLLFTHPEDMGRNQLLHWKTKKRPTVRKHVVLCKDGPSPDDLQKNKIWKWIGKNIPSFSTILPNVQ